MNKLRTLFHKNLETGVFEEKNLKKLYKPKTTSFKKDNGQVVIIGGSSLFHGAPILALQVAARICDLVFFASPEKSTEEIASKVKATLPSFIWVPISEIDDYVQKADACLIGPGLMRFREENLGDDEEGKKTRQITEAFLKKFSKKQWVVDGGSLQVISPEILPPKSIVTPNRKEYKMLFGSMEVEEASQKYNLIIIQKGIQTKVCSPKEGVIIEGGNAGLTKGGTGDVLAGLTVGLAAKNDPFLAASAASFFVKEAADYLYRKVGFAYSAEDLAETIPLVLGKYYR